MANKNIVQTAKQSGNFDTLLKALDKAGLKSALEGEGPYTVFAPSDSAFEKLPKDKVQNLMKSENRSELRRILRRHVVPGNLPSDEIRSRKYESLGGQMVEAKVSGTSVRFENAKVSKPDIECSNGYIHVIDSVATG